MIRLNDLSFRYGAGSGGDGQLNSINLHVRPGEFIILTGSSGCGKTTLTRVLNGLCPQFYPGTLTGGYELYGRDAMKITISELGTMIGSVFQDPRSQFYATNTTDEIVLGMENNATPRKEMHERLDEVNALIGLETLLGKPIFPLSSGEKQRVAIASVCAMRPGVLVLDEPSANLDSAAIIRLGALLYRLKEAGTTIILSEHRLHYVKKIFDRMIRMEDGRIAQEYTRDEALALTERQMDGLGLRRFAEPRITPGRSMEYSKTAKLSAYDLSISFGGLKVLDEASFSLDSGHILAIVGGNGAGKSSLCRVLTGLYKQNIGQVLLSGQACKCKRRTRSMFFVQQDTDYQLYAATVEDEFYIGKHRGDISKSLIEDFLLDVGLQGVMERHPLSLSGGQKQRLLLALAVASGKELLLLDEPTSGLDGANMRMIADLLNRIAKQGKTIILITHDLELVNATADSILFMDKGKVVYHRALQK